MSNSDKNSSQQDIQVSIITSAHQVSDARLHRIAFAVMNAGLTCEIIAPGKIEDSPAGSHFVQAPYSRSFLGRILRDITLPFKTRGKVVIALAPYLLPLTKFATKMKKQFFAVDLFEDYLDLLNDRKWAKGAAGYIGKLIAYSAVEIAKNADLTSVADEQVRPLHAQKRIVLKNLPSLNMLPDTYLHLENGSWEVIDKPFVRNEKPTAIYIGDIRESRGLSWILHIASHSPQWNFVLIGNASESDRERISSYSNISYLGPMSPQESWKHAIGAWVGLSLLQPTPAFKKAIPSKLYEYAAVGLPILSSELPRPVALISQAKNGEIIDYPELADVVLTRWEKDPSELNSLAHNGLHWIANFMNNEDNYGQYVRCIKEALAIN